MKTFIIPALFVLTIGCATIKLATPEQADIDRSNKFPDYTLAELQQGKVLYEQKCAACHKLKKPSSQTEIKWGKIVPVMTEKANKKSVMIDEKQQELILKYLVTMCSAPKK